MAGRLRSSMGYCGCSTIEQMRTKAESCEITIPPGNVRDPLPKKMKVLYDKGNATCSALKLGAQM